MLNGVPICVFAKPPHPGKAKTRLIPSLGEHGAALLADALLQDTLDSIAGLGWAKPIIATTEPCPELGSREFPVWLQGDGDLGIKIERILQHALELSDAAIAIGADSPGLPVTSFEKTRQLLDHNDIVIGPCTDGGFYLLGVKSYPSGLLDGISWSQPATLRQTLARFKTQGFTVALLDPWFDIDRPEDLSDLADLLLAGSVRATHTAQALAQLLPSALRTGQ